MASLILSRRVVLVADDEPLVRMFAADMLEDAGFKVLEAANATEALALLQARPDILVLLADVEMPGGINGFELARAVAERWPYIGIVIMSGRERPSEGDMPRGSAFVPKPCTARMLLEYVRVAADRAEGALVCPTTASAEPKAVIEAAPMLPAGLMTEPMFTEGTAGPLQEPDR